MAEPFYRGVMPRIMIVDDDHAIAQSLSDLIISEGYETRLAYVWHGLFRELKQSHIDLIILDIMMPEISGIEIVRLLKQHEEYRKIPVIMITSMDIHTAKNLIKPCYSQFLLRKPFDTDKLLQTIFLLCPI